MKRTWRLSRKLHPAVVASYLTGERIKDIAKRFGITPSYVRRIAADRGIPGRKTAKLIKGQKHEIVCLKAFTKVKGKQIGWWFGITPQRVSAIYQEAICRHLQDHRLPKSQRTSTRRTMKGSNRALDTDGQRSCER